MSPETAPSATDVGGSPAASLGLNYTRWALVLFMLISAVGFVDRTILNTVGQAIKVDLKLSDLQLGLLAGAAFAIFNGVMGIPIARLAERVDRVWIVAVAVAAWSGMTALCGAAGSFWQLALVRVGVGVADAGGASPIQSLIADYFPPERRASALSVYILGVPLGIVVGAVGSGWIAQHLSWRVAFLVVGAPGLFLAVLTRLTLKEVPRGWSEGLALGAEAAPPLSAVVRRLARNPAFLHILAGASIVNFVGYSGMGFLHPYLVRAFHVGYTKAAVAYAAINSLSLAAGFLIGGLVTDRLVKRDVRFYGWLPALGLLLAGPAYILGFEQRSWPIAVGVLILPGLFSATYYSPTFAVTLNAVEPRMRASAIALVTLAINLLGMTLGPAVTGWLSDRYAASAFTPGDYGRLCPGGKALARGGAALARACGDASAIGIRHALETVCLLFLWASLHFLLAGRTLRQDLAGPAATPEEKAPTRKPRSNQ